MGRAPDSATRRDSFDGLVAEHESVVLGICRSVLHDEHLGADAAQETFVRPWRRIGEGRAPLALGAWLKRVAISTSLAAGTLAPTRTRGAPRTSAPGRPSSPPAGLRSERSCRTPSRTRSPATVITTTTESLP
jgi:hypothetical protein